MAGLLLAYGKEYLAVEILQENLLGVLKIQSHGEHQDSQNIIEASLASPIHSSEIEQLFSSRNKTTIVLPDKTRKCASREFLPVLVNLLNLQNILDSDIQILLANGSHTGHTDEEITAIIGEDMLGRLDVFEHDSKNRNVLVYVGETGFGTPVYVNRRVLECDRLLVAGTVVHHYFAGFGGGPKMIVPGCAGYETITKNHALAIESKSSGLHPFCRPGTIENNPIQEDIREALQWLDVDFLFETVLNENGKMIAAFSGELFETHKLACDYVNRIFKICVKEKADFVLASCGGFPKDINVIQAHKTLYNAYQCVKDGGVIFILAECSQGVGSKTFLEWFDFSSEDERRLALSQQFTLNATTAVSIQEKTKKAKIVLLSSLPDALVRKLGMIPVASLEKGLNLVRTMLPEKHSTYVLPNGSLTLPEVVA